MIKSLTSLRGIFILFIFFHHCLNIYPGGGSMAVAFFFVLGGFSMTLGYKEKVLRSDFCYKSYLTKRCIKFYPLHWLCLLTVMPLVLFSFSPTDIPVFLANASLLQAWIPIQKVYFSFNWVSWYLADTMFFAVMFPLLFRWIAISGTRGRVIIAALFAIIYGIVAFIIPTESYHAILYISPYMRLFDFVFGIYLALLYFKLNECPSKLWNGSVVWQLIIIMLIVLLVVESSILPKDIRRISPVYWALVAVVILMASLTSGRTWGGANSGK